MDCLSRVKNRGDMRHKTLQYCFINKPKLGRFYLLHNIQKQLRNVPGRPVILKWDIRYEKHFSFFGVTFEAIARKS